jgi:hypothetical protein
MVTMLEECITKEQRSVVHFHVQKDSMQKIPTKKCWLFMLGSICRVKQFHLGGKHFADDEEFETEVWKWLRQQSKDFYAAGFDALVRRWDKCFSVGRGHVKK